MRTAFFAALLIAPWLAAQQPEGSTGTQDHRDRAIPARPEALEAGVPKRFAVPEHIDWSQARPAQFPGSRPLPPG